MLSDSWPASQTLSYCTRVRIHPDYWSLSPTKLDKELPKVLPLGQIGLYWCLSRIFLTGAVTSQQFISDCGNTLFRAICEPDLGFIFYFFIFLVFNKPVIFEGTDVDWGKGDSAVGIDEVRIWASCSCILPPLQTCLTLGSSRIFELDERWLLCISESGESVNSQFVVGRVTDALVLCPDLDTHHFGTCQ